MTTKDCKYNYTYSNKILNKANTKSLSNHNTRSLYSKELDKNNFKVKNSINIPSKTNSEMVKINNNFNNFNKNIDSILSIEEKISLIFRIQTNNLMIMNLNLFIDFSISSLIIESIESIKSESKINKDALILIFNSASLINKYNPYLVSMNESDITKTDNFCKDIICNDYNINREINTLKLRHIVNNYSKLDKNNSIILNDIKKDLKSRHQHNKENKDIFTYNTSKNCINLKGFFYVLNKISEILFIDEFILNKQMALKKLYNNYLSNLISKKSISNIGYAYFDLNIFQDLLLEQCIDKKLMSKDKNKNKFLSKEDYNVKETILDNKHSLLIIYKKYFSNECNHLESLNNINIDKNLNYLKFNAEKCVVNFMNKENISPFQIWPLGIKNLIDFLISKKLIIHNLINKNFNINKDITEKNKIGNNVISVNDKLNLSNFGIYFDFYIFIIMLYIIGYKTNGFNNLIKTLLLKHNFYNKIDKIQYLYENNNNNNNNNIMLGNKDKINNNSNIASNEYTLYSEKLKSLNTRNNINIDSNNNIFNSTFICNDKLLSNKLKLYIEEQLPNTLTKNKDTCSTINNIDIISNKKYIINEYINIMHKSITYSEKYYYLFFNIYKYYIINFQESNELTLMNFKTLLKLVKDINLLENNSIISYKNFKKTISSDLYSYFIIYELDQNEDKLCKKKGYIDYLKFLQIIIHICIDKFNYFCNFNYNKDDKSILTLIDFVIENYVHPHLYNQDVFNYQNSLFYNYDLFANIYNQKNINNNKLQSNINSNNISNIHTSKYNDSTCFISAKYVESFKKFIIIVKNLLNKLFKYYEPIDLIKFKQIIRNFNLINVLSNKHFISNIFTHFINDYDRLVHKEYTNNYLYMLINCSFRNYTSNIESSDKLNYDFKSNSSILFNLQSFVNSFLFIAITSDSKYKFDITKYKRIIFNNNYNNNISDEQMLLLIYQNETFLSNKLSTIKSFFKKLLESKHFLTILESELLLKTNLNILINYKY